jgi:hypothetical protein
MDRFKEIRLAAEQAKKLGIVDQAARREAIIDANSAHKKGILSITYDQAQNFPSVARKNINDEPQEVIDRAIDKYIYFKKGLARIPVLVDAVHAKKPLPEEGDSKDFDERTFEIATKVAELTGSSIIIGKKSRMRSDLNRAWWHQEERNGFKSKEYSRSGKAALYWAIKKILVENDRLDEEGQLKNNFYRISIHGMKDNDAYDYAIGGSKNLADQQFLWWFKGKMQASLSEVGLEPRVVIARDDDPLTKSYSGASSLRYFRLMPEKDYLVQHPAFGIDFQTVQLEVASHIRKNSEKREAFCLALANVIKDLK